MFQVIKRDGSIVPFEIVKISSAINKAFKAVNRKSHPDVIDMLSLKVTSEFDKLIKDNKISVESIQDLVEDTLIKAGYTDVAKAYILYRRQREKTRNVTATILDYKEIVNSYVDSLDYGDSEANSNYSIGGLILSNSGAITTNYWLSEIYDDEISSVHKNGDIFIHDLSMLTARSTGWSLKDIILKGLSGNKTSFTSSPAKHLIVLCNQLVNFLSAMQNEWAGAQFLSSFDTYLAPFVKVDNLKYEDVKQSIQTFIYGLNTPSWWGSKIPFITLSFDLTPPLDLANQNCLVGGKEVDFKYSDCIKEMDMINKAFLEVMLEGDAKSKSFMCPLPIYSLSKNFKFDETENNKLLFEFAAKTSLPIFANYLNSEICKEDVRFFIKNKKVKRSELIKLPGGIYNTVDYSGSVGLVSINLPRIAYLSSNIEDFYRRLDKLMDISARSLHIKRQVITQLLNSGLYPYTKNYLKNLNNHFLSIGVVGVNEMCLNAKWLSSELFNKESQNFASDVLSHMADNLLKYQEHYNELFSLVSTHDETILYRLASLDRQKYPDIKVLKDSKGREYYTNSCELMEKYNDDIFNALDIQNNLLNYFSSGSLFKIKIKDKSPDIKVLMSLIQKLSENYSIPYYKIISKK